MATGTDSKDHALRSLSARETDSAPLRALCGERALCPPEHAGHGAPKYQVALNRHGDLTSRFIFNQVSKKDKKKGFKMDA